MSFLPELTDSHREVMKYIPLDIDGLLLVEPVVYSDDRGYFVETYRQADMEQALGRTVSFVQENQSGSVYGVLRGIHLQLGEAAQAKLVRCVHGRIIDVVVDLRPESRYFGNHTSVELSADNHRQLYIPRGFGHAFVALSPQVVFQYKVDNLYAPQSECCIRYDDPDLGIEWGRIAPELSSFLLSPKDLAGISFREYRELYGSGKY
ncbi:dTDP-4-dehydrorhamnose 3,5-epimerase [Porphyromonas crevioricanis JCM 13913]|nr:dTDP-4-dehydrorhamnose 3,5-epimerase [Porphyromonas crevioricanis JCM 13913]